jgi:hypothetical protein
MARLNQPWQLRALSYYDSIGEINFTSKFLARQISRVRFFPALRLEDGTTEPITSGAPVEILNQIQDPGGGTTQVQYDYGHLMFLTGEGVLFNYSDTDRWKFLWKDEVKRAPDGIGWVQVNHMQEVVAEGVGYRIWSPHPRWSDLADSPMRAVQDICELILLLTMQTRATTVSRLTNGLFLVPQEASFGPVSVGLDEDPQQNPFMSDMLEHAENQIENPGTPPAALPFFAEVPAEYIDAFKWVKMHDPSTDYMELEQLKEQIRRLALSLDMSPEDLLGYTDANHWTTRSVQLDRWRMFGYNKAELWATSVNDAYLRPALIEDGYSDWARVIINFEDSQVVINPDRTEDALAAHKQGLLSAASTLEALGWAPKDRMEGSEYDEWFALQLRQVPESMNDVLVPERGPLPTANGNGNAADGPPAPGTNTGVSRKEAVTASARMLGAAELALLRCRDLAGTRLRFKCPDCAEGHPASMVASALGEQAAPDPDKLVSGGTDGFQEMLIGQGIPVVQATALGKQLEKFAARTLYQPKCPDLPSGFVAAVSKAQEATVALAH